MKEEKQRKFHEALLKMLYPPPPDNDEEKEDDRKDSSLIESLNNLPEEDIDNVEQSPSNSDSKSGDEKMTRAQRKRLRKRKLKEAATQRRKIIGPLFPPGLNDGVDGSHGSAEDACNVADEGVRENTATQVSGDLSHSHVEASSNSPEGARRCATINFSEEEEASCLSRNKLKLKQRRKLKKMVVAKSTPSSSSDRNHGLKITVDDKVDS